MQNTLKPFLSLMFIGISIMFLALYVQASSMDLNKFSFSQYIASDSQILAWWQTVAIPLIVGFVYFIVALVCLRIKPTPLTTLLVLLACIFTGIILCLANTWAGFFPVVTLPLFTITPARAVLAARKKNV